MTCIVGIAEGGVVYMAGDSAGSNGYDVVVVAQPKVFRNGDFLIGYTTSFRMGQLLQYALKPPAVPEGESDYGYMVTVFVDAVRECLKAGGYAAKDKEQESAGEFLVGWRGHLYTVHDNYSVLESTLPFAAVGCGERYAMGALLASAESEPYGRLKVALQVAEHLSAGVRRPWHVLDTRGA